MSPFIQFFVEGTPVGYSRDSAVLRHTPENVKAWRSKVRAAYRATAPAHWPREGEYTAGVGLEIQAFGTKADADNLAKEVMDALSELAYRDDSQILEMGVSIADRTLSEYGKPCAPKLTAKEKRETPPVKQGMLVTLSLYGLTEVA